MFGVINLVEERFLGWIDIHADDEDVTRGERHGLASLDGEKGCVTFYVSPLCQRFVSIARPCAVARMPNDQGREPRQAYHEFSTLCSSCSVVRVRASSVSPLTPYTRASCQAPAVRP